MNNKEKLEETLVDILKESSVAEYWNAKEIDRSMFTVLLKYNEPDMNGNNYMITVDSNDAARFKAKDDEEAKRKFQNYIDRKDLDEAKKEDMFTQDEIKFITARLATILAKLGKGATMEVSSDAKLINNMLIFEIPVDYKGDLIGLGEDIANALFLDLKMGKINKITCVPESTNKGNKFILKIEGFKDSIIIESNDKNTADDQPMVYMNTWKNYNQYGADLVLYNNIDGWMTVEDARNFAEKYNLDEPFINDTENIPWYIDEYDAVMPMFDYIEKYQNCDDKPIIRSLIEECNSLEDAFKVYESGDYIFFEGVDNDVDLAKAYIDLLGGLDLVQNANDYIDGVAYRESWREIAKENIRQENPNLEDEDEFEARVEELLDIIAQDQLDDAIMNDLDLSEYFDYEDYGAYLATSYLYTDDGAISLL